MPIKIVLRKGQAINIIQNELQLRNDFRIELPFTKFR